MLLCRDDQQQMFSLIKEQRRAGGDFRGAGQFKCHAIYQYYAAIDWQVAIDVLSTHALDEVKVVTRFP